MHDDCEFCQIHSGDRSAHVLREDERTIAFLDRNPAAPGHSLVIPRVHEEDVLTIDESVSTAVFDTVRIVSTALEAALEPNGFSVFHTSGPLVGTVDHAHVHLVPRFADDDVALSLPRDRLDPDEAAHLRDRVRAHL
ncbi:HIT family protein [Natrinema sp. CBA1119]|uniref:HIT family protein n=1 Tax=Natrinema sp. CBA1119 TaxID=1608465 RepID=UPI000BF31F4E|nr:HIT family protein [Natrinema sp. CBA1119]PGF16436.1 HIT family protein [Natrinema sp. CBA1119]